MANSNCKCKPTDCEECPEWIFTFADLVMLMMGFFVILWVLKPAPGKNNENQKLEDEWIKVVAAIRDAFGYIPDPTSKDPVDVELILRKLQKMKPLAGPGEGGRTQIKRDGAEGIDELVRSIRDGRQSVVGGSLAFDAGKSDLTPDTLRALDQIAEKVRGHRNIVFVKGHASLDDFADGGGTAQQRMDLSIRRAQAVANYLTGKQVETDILRVIGCSTFEPVRQHVYGDNAQAGNRRVEIQATDSIVEDRQDNSNRAGAPATQPATPAHYGSTHASAHD